MLTLKEPHYAQARHHPHFTQPAWSSSQDLFIFVDLFSWAVQIDGLGPKNLKGTLGCKVQLDTIEPGLEMTRVYVPGHKMRYIYIYVYIYI